MTDQQDSRLKSRVAPWIKCSGQQVNYIWAMPRTRNPLTKETDPDLIVHLVNGKHSTNTDVVTLNSNFTLEIRKELLAGRTLQRILCYEVPDPEPRTLTCTETDTGIKIIVPELYIWNIIRLEFDAASHPSGSEEYERSRAFYPATLLGDDRAGCRCCGDGPI